MIPHQKHKSRGKGGKQSRTDKSKAFSGTKKSKSSRQAGMESSAGGGPKGMAKRPKGTPIAAPGGRNSRANTYGS